MSVKNLNHSGKVVFVGIDVHKKTYTVSAGGDHTPVDRVSNLPADPKSLVKFLKKRFRGAKIKSAYEAGFSGFVLHRVLVESGIDNIVVNAASIEVAANDRVKNDKRDANKIRVQLQRGQLEGIEVPSIEEELARQLQRTRTQIVRHRVRVGNQIKSKLMQFGFIPYNDETRMTPKYLGELKKKRLPKELAVAISALSETYDTLTEQIKNLESEMAEQAEEEPEIEKIYQSAPGIGKISSRILATEIGDMSHFPNQKSLYSFTGLTPSEYSSGDKQRRGNITRQGRIQVRAVLIEVAWRAIKDDKSLRAVYDRIKVRAGGKKAIVAVARRLIGHLRACHSKGELYTPRPI